MNAFLFFVTIFFKSSSSIDATFDSILRNKIYVPSRRSWILNWKEQKKAAWSGLWVFDKNERENNEKYTFSPNARCVALERRRKTKTRLFLMFMAWRSAIAKIYLSRQRAFLMCFVSHLSHFFSLFLSSHLLSLNFSFSINSYFTLQLSSIF